MFKSVEFMLMLTSVMRNDFSTNVNNFFFQENLRKFQEQAKQFEESDTLRSAKSKFSVFSQLKVISVFFFRSFSFVRDGPL